MSSNSNIRVFVQWSEQSVFAGESIECQITFKNVAAISGVSKPLHHPAGFTGHTPGGGEQRKMTTVAQNKSSSLANTCIMPISRGHRATLSLNAPTGDGASRRGSVLRKGGPNEAGIKEHSHRRSISIISLGNAEGAGDEAVSQFSLGERSRKPSRGHARASSLQIIPRRSGANGSGLLSTSLSQRSTTHPSPLFHTSAPPKELNLRSNAFSHENPSITGQQLDISTAPNTPGAVKGSNMRRKDSGSLPQNFRFPTTAILQEHRLSDISKQDESVNPLNTTLSNRLLLPRRREDVPIIMEQTSSSTQVLPTTSNGETPRSSGEFYSLSNNSTETLVSEYLTQQPDRLQSRGTDARRTSALPSTNQARPLETLMMGYVQICGSFTLDSSLISQAPFEDIKRKGVLGGQGGGVIGLEMNKKESGLFRGFGWGNLGESFGNFLGSGELSSIKDMRGTAGSRAIPILSTPQSILFVDLRLAPGESRSYKYSFKLPTGLPPSHRGKAIKIVYNLIIGTQRPGGAKEQQVKSVAVPFRILGSVNEHGEPLGHDLMSPYIILHDQARIQCLDSFQSMPPHPPESDTKRLVKSESILKEFLAYINDLILQPRQNSSIGLLSPTEAARTRRPSSFGEPSSVKESIDIAILRSNLTMGSQQSANRFEVSRNGQRVAVIMLARPAYRLGETITVAIDFSDAEIQCYALYAALETSEKVDPAIALRSDATINRVTRRVHSSHSECTLFARRVVFFPTIPVTGTPGFTTSGVSLEWKILMEFVAPSFERCDNGGLRGSLELLEEVSRDGRGMVLAAAESLNCESFEVVVPIRVYGALAGNIEKVEPVEGLAV